VRTIAAEAGVSTGTITHTRRIVDGLLGDVLTEASERFTEGWLREVRSLPDAIARMRHVVDANLPGTAEILPLWRLWLDAWAARRARPGGRARPRARHASERETVGASSPRARRGNGPV
jgi:AcrR family transcriptional regulator